MQVASALNDGSSAERDAYARARAARAVKVLEVTCNVSPMTSDVTCDVLCGSGHGIFCRQTAGGGGWVVRR